MSKKNPLSDEQRQVLGACYEHCVTISDKLTEYQTVARKYQTACEDGLQQALEEEILEEIEDESIRLFQRVKEALEFQIPPSKVISLRGIIPEEHQDLFPTISVKGKEV